MNDGLRATWFAWFAWFVARCRMAEILRPERGNSTRTVLTFRRLTTAGAMLALLVVAACGGDDDGESRGSCDDCNPGTQYCQEHIVDGPSSFSCEPFPAACGTAPDCNCIVPVACPQTLQSCEADEDGLFVIECVEG